MTEPRLHPVSAALSLLIAVAVSGCGTMKAYSGPELPPEEIAVIKPERMLGQRVTITSVDGKEADFGINSFAVKPGRHEVAVNTVACSTIPIYVSGSFIYIPACKSSASTTLLMYADAAQTYVVKGKLKYGGDLYWIVNETTGQIVAGDRPERTK